MTPSPLLRTELSRRLAAAVKGDAMETQQRSGHGAEPSLGSEMIAEVYDELRALAAGYAARECDKQAPTSMVHEAIVRIGSLTVFESRVELFAAVANTIRRS